MTTSCRAAIVGFACCVSLAWPVAASEGGSLSRLVSEDAGVCVQLHTLAPKIREFAQGEFCARGKAFPPFERWRAEHEPELHQLSTELRVALGVGARELAGLLLNREGILAIWPRDEATFESDAIVALEANDAALLNEVVTRLRDAQHAESAWRVTRIFERKGTQHTVYEIPPKRGVERVWFTAVGDLALASNSERRLNDALRRLDADAGGSLAESKVYAEARKRVSPDAAVTLFINSHSWGAQLTMLREAPEIDPLSRPVFNFLSATDYWIGACELGDIVRFEGFHAWRHSDLPPAIAQAVTLASGAADFFEHTPREAVVAFAGRMDLTRGRLQATLRSGPQRAPFIEHAILSLATAMGPQGGLYFAPSEHHGGDPSPVPWSWVVGLGLANVSAADREKTGSDQLRALFDAGASLFAAQSAVVSSDAPKLTRETIEGARVTTIGIKDLLLADAISVHFAHDFLWAGSNASAVASATRLEAKNSLASDPDFVELHNPRMEAPGWIAHFRTSALAEQMRAAPAGIDALATRANLPRDDARKSADELASLLRLFDRITFEARLDEGGAAFAAAFAARPPKPAE